MTQNVQSGKSSVPLLRACALTKIFPGKVANRNVSMDVFCGEVHALLGENGAGKSTLVNMLSGMIPCDGGKILWKGYEPLSHVCNSKDSTRIGMVHQHYSLVLSFTLVENLMLLERSSLLHPFLRRERVKKRLAELSGEFGIVVPFDTPMGALSVGEQQLGELLKALYFDCELLILDEPTAVLTPQEVERLWVIVRNFTAHGRAVILIAHKISEVLEIADTITVLRDGEHVATMKAAETTAGDLAQLMVGRQLKDVRSGRLEEGADIVLQMDDVSESAHEGHVALQHISLRVHKGEILGIAGVDGNGQRQLFHLLARRKIPASGSVLVNGEPLDRSSFGCANAARHTGRIPDDRQRYGLAMGMSVCDNLMLTKGASSPFASAGLRRLRLWRKHALALMQDFDVRCTGPEAAARTLSGGNQQKLILARELASGPDILLVSNPTRGLDVGAIEMIHEKLLAAAASGCAILLISNDLDEVLSLSHRVAVIHGGRIVGHARGPDYNLAQIGLMMAGQEVAA